VPSARITILVDNNPGAPGLRTAWGFSALVEAGDLVILFDGGPSPETLRENAEALGVDLSEVDLVVLSHCHGDHAGGLSLLREVNPGATVYAPPGAGVEGLPVVECRSPARLGPGVVTTGPMYGPPWEQGLVVNVTGVGAVLITGCAHPGVDSMAERAAELTGSRVAVVLGGFHLGGASEQRLEQIARVLESLGAELVVPVHCSGDRARAFVSERMPGAYAGLGVGGRVEVSALEISVSP